MNMSASRRPETKSPWFEKATSRMAQTAPGTQIRTGPIEPGAIPRSARCNAAATLPAATTASRTGRPIPGTNQCAPVRPKTPATTITRPRDTIGHRVMAEINMTPSAKRTTEAPPLVWTRAQPTIADAAAAAANRSARSRSAWKTDPFIARNVSTKSRPLRRCSL